MIRFIAWFLIVVGSLVLILSMGWVLSYFTERGFDIKSLSLSFTTEILYWLPVVVLAIPGAVLIHHGRCLLAKGKVPAFAVGEIAVVFAILGVIGAFIFPPDNFSFVAASIVSKGIEASEPVQEAVVSYHKEHGVFPNSRDLPVIEQDKAVADQHIRSIVLGDKGRIIVTFDTQDIDWSWRWWHRLFFLESNDLTGKTLVLVPIVVENEVAWEECEAGSMPKRNRHFKCSRHK